MGLGDFVPDVIEDKVEQGVELIGEGIEELGDVGADLLEDVGWESGADWVRDKSRSAANALGADVDELQLGQTEDPKKLIYGSAEKLRSTASHLKDFAKAFDNVGKGIKGLDASGLKGEAADAFREKIAKEPPRWFKAADACEKAAGALEDFAGTVEWAQGRAKEAISKYKAAVKASEEARTAHNQKVDAYNKAADAYNAKVEAGQDPGTKPQPPGKFHDPGPAKAKEAEEILAEARKQRNTAAEKARSAVRAARDAAPEKPSYGEQVKYGVVGVHLDASHFYGGVIKGATGIVSFARSINPTDPYNITHPAEYLTNLNSTVAGLVQVANNPWGAGKQMLDQFLKDPAEGFGRLAPDALLTAATGGAGAGVKAVRLAGEAADLAKNANRVGNVSDGPGRSTINKDGPDQHDSKPGDKNTKGSDPVDLATGKMFLPQTDITLPGAMPLVFTRYVESGYTAGRWFGPSWASTVDQRLEVDAEGVVFVAEDGRLLAYQHPAPGVPTLPSAGAARMPLERTPDGGYTLTDPETGWVRHFAPPPGGADGEARIEQITDRAGHQILFVYDEATGAPLRIEHSGGYTLRLTTENGRVTALSLAGAGEGGTDQMVKRYGYTDGHLTEVADSRGRPLRFEYDDEARVIAWIDSNDRRYDYVYDNLHRCIAEGGTEGHMQVRISYDEVDAATGYQVTTLTTAAGHATRHLIDDHHRTVATTDPLGHTTRFRHDEHGRLLEVTDPLGRTTRFTYNDHGHVVEITRPDGRQITVTRNDLGLPTEVREADGAVWRYAYDERGQRISTTDPAGHTTRYAYDGRGHLAAVTNALGETTSVRCDAAGLPVEITDPLGAVTRYTRDAFGRPTTITDPLGAVTRLEWTVEGKLARRVGPDGAEESWEYDGEGNCIRHTNAVGGTTTFEYTHFDLLAARTGPDGARYEFEYDKTLRLTTVTNPHGETWIYSYDPADRLVSEQDFGGCKTSYAYDAAGRLISRVNPLGQKVSYMWDEVDRIVRKVADGKITTFSYDAAGRLSEAISPEVEVRWQYDKVGRVKSEMVNGRVLTFSYDALGRPARRATPTGATTVYTYDAAGNRATLTASGHILEFAYDAAGNEVYRGIGGRLALTQTWDPAGRLTGQILFGSNADTVQRRIYRYRADGYLTDIDDILTGSRSFKLDEVGRITAVTGEDWKESYAYDTLGNQVRAEWPTYHTAVEAMGDRVYASTRIRAAGAIRYQYDAAGRIALRQKTRLSKKPDTWRYEWDAEDRLRVVTTPDGTVWRYLYDPLGRRTAKQRMDADGETVLEQVDFTWDGPILVEQTTTAPGLPHPVTLTWEHDGFAPLSQTERITDATTQREIDARFFAIVTDLVGTPSELVDESGEIAWRTRTTLWGTTAWAASSTAYTPLRFPGQYYDPETGLHYNYHRYYDPTTARYITSDPLGIEPSPNCYAYVHNPHALTDPMGLAPKVPKGDHGDPLNLSAGYTGRIDRFPMGHSTDFEIHVYKNKKEVGVFGSEGWIHKHGLGDAVIPESVENRLKGHAVDFMRKTGRLGPKGTEDISGDKWQRPRLKGGDC